MSTPPLTPPPAPQPGPIPPTVTPKAPVSGFKSFLKGFGQKALDVLKWIGSPQNQRIITTGEILAETAATAINPALAGISPIINAWTQEIFKAEALGASAVAGAETNTAKSAAVLTSVTPQVLAWAAQNKLPAPTDAKLQQANDALVAFLNAFDSNEPATPTS